MTLYIASCIVILVLLAFQYFSGRENKEIFSMNLKSQLSLQE